MRASEVDKYVVAIIDISSPFSGKRPEAIGGIVSQVPNVAAVHCRTGEGWRRHTPSSDVDVIAPPGPIFLALVHSGELERAAFAEDIAGRTAHIVYYTGGIVPQSVPHDECWIAAPLTARPTAVTPERVQEVIAWMDSGRQGERPRLLRPPAMRELLSALSVLCQAFLAAHAERDNGGHWGPSEIANALDRMRWPELAESPQGQALARHASDSRARVARSEWWKPVVAHVDEPKLQVRYEWQDGPRDQLAPVLALLNEIETLPSISRQVVADAYLALVAEMMR
jgi:hypothetical protein